MPNLTPSQLRHKQVTLWRIVPIWPIFVLYPGIFVTVGVASLVVYVLRATNTLPGPLATTGLGFAADGPGSTLYAILVDQILLGGLLLVPVAWPRLVAEAVLRINTRRRSVRRHRRRKPSRRWRLVLTWLFAINMLLPLAVVPLWAYYAISSHYAGGWSSVATLTLVYLAWLLIALSTLHLGSGRRCSRCEYHMTTFRGSPDLCPECGSHWKSLGGTVFGHRPPRALLYLGLALLLAAAAIWALVPIR